ELLRARRRKLDAVLHTLRTSIMSVREGQDMAAKELFKGFENEEEWKDALSEHNLHLKETYGVEPLQVKSDEVEQMNAHAAEAAAFMSDMADALREGIKHSDNRVRERIRLHLTFLNENGLSTSPVE